MLKTVELLFIKEKIMKENIMKFRCTIGKTIVLCNLNLPTKNSYRTIPKL